MPSPKPRGRHAVKSPAEGAPSGEAPWTSPASLAMAASYPSKRERMPVKPVVIVTRKLPDLVETRMMELFDVRLNLSTTPMTQARLIEAVKAADVLVPTVTDQIDAAVLSQAGERLKLIASFGTGVDHIDLEDRPPARHHA